MNTTLCAKFFLNFRRALWPFENCCTSSTPQTGRSSDRLAWAFFNLSSIVQATRPNLLLISWSSPPNSILILADIIGLRSSDGSNGTGKGAAMNRFEISRADSNIPVLSKRGPRFATKEQVAARKHNTAAPYFRLIDPICKGFMELATDPSEFEGLK